MAVEQPESGELLRQAAQGDAEAIRLLLGRHRSRLRRMVAVRLDPRLAARIDPSDVVQESLADASRRLAEYVQQPSLPFYPWLRRIAWERLSRLHRHHVRTSKRSVAREEELLPNLPEESAINLANHLAGSATSPSARLTRKERRGRVRAALRQLEPQDREVLVMRHLEQLHVREIAAILGITEAAVKMRRLRAARRFQELLGDDFLEE